MIFLAYYLVNGCQNSESFRLKIRTEIGNIKGKYEG